MLRRIVLFSAAVANLLLVDQLVKAASVSSLQGRPPVEVIHNLFDLAYVENRGCAWGMLQGHVWPLAVFGIAVMGLLIWKRKNFGTTIPSLKSTRENADLTAVSI